MDLDLVFLGTSASTPTASRAPAALLVRRGGERLLFDCAEGTQRQLMRSTLGLPDLEEIFLTHYHADHTLGLPGMLKTFALRQREVPLTIYGPPGLRELFGDLRRIIGRLTYPVETVEVRAGEALERDGVPDPRRSRASRCQRGRLRARRGRPARPVRRRGRRRARRAAGAERGALQRGESITLDDGRVITPGLRCSARRAPGAGSCSPATPRRPTRCRCSRKARTSSSTRRPSARRSATARLETLHSTAKQAAEIAAAAGVRLLALTHLSARYFGRELLEEAREIFPATVVPRDFDVIEVPYAERGEPQLIKRGRAAASTGVRHLLGELPARRGAAPAPGRRPA